jgi:hypothetical protein
MLSVRAVYVLSSLQLPIVEKAIEQGLGKLIAHENKTISDKKTAAAKHGTSPA